MEYRNKIISFCLGALLFFSLASVQQVHAFGLLNDKVVNEKIGQQEEAFRESAGYEVATTQTVPQIVAMVIKAFIGLLGIIFVVLIVYSGYNWMTAGGDETKITKAKNTISRAVIGLIILLAAYSITYFVFSNLDSVVDSDGGGMTGS